MKKVLETIVLLSVFVAGFWYLQDVFMPRYSKTNIPEGLLTKEYYDSTFEHEVVFLGDCEVFENISTVTLFEKYGIHSYIRGNAQQQVWHSYYMLEELLQYETPKVIVFNVNALRYDEPVSEPYNRLVADRMKWSSSKWNMIQDAKMEDESMLDYIFPLFRYHSRYSEITLDDFSLQEEDTVTYAGYLMNCEVKPLTTLPKPEPLRQKDFSSNVYKYLDKIVALCADNNVELILMKAPTLHPHWYEEWDEKMIAYASKHNIRYYNFINDIDEIGLNFAEDTSDAGIHLNVYGAEKFADYLGRLLKSERVLTDYRENEKIARWWKPIIEKYKKEKEKN